MKLDYVNHTPYLLEQGDNMFHFGSDAEFLGSFLRLKHSDTVLDIGTNQGVLLCYAAMYKPALLCGIDLYPDTVSLAQSNMKRNSIQAEIVCTRLQDYVHEPFSVLLSNPPYYAWNAQNQQQTNGYLAAARYEKELTLGELFMHSRRLLKDTGRLFLVYRTERLNELLAEAEKTGFCPVRIRFAYTGTNGEAKLVCLEFRKGARMSLRIERPAFLDQRETYWKGEEK